MLVSDELVPEPEVGRVFAREVTPGLADAAPSGRIRLDALARWIQDVAHADVTDAGLADRAVWVVRRLRVWVERFPRFGDAASVRTFCSGSGRMWAERRTSIATPGGGRVETAALWVHLDPVSLRPSPLDEDELALYAPSTLGRQVKARLHHPAPPETPGARRPWQFRATDLDLAGHVNNAAYWAPFEEELLGGDAAEPAALDGELEFRTPAQPGRFDVLVDGARRWIVAESGEVHASLALAAP
ncbi:MAG TPA: acyl-ACP thioesterase domain-containing protein [Baekduia sp.]|nr:acyl-ACP thioesterase domain-containing protein [Baekduia sp.]